MGFHGDPNLRAVVDYLSESSKFYVETGTHKGHTFSYMVRKYPHIECFGCEPAKGRFDIALSRTKEFRNAKIFNETSQRLINRIKKNHSRIFEGPILFWLDAHSKFFEWPLAKELTFFTKHTKVGNIIIDDFFVPGEPQFRSNKYGNQRYNFQYIRPFLSKKHKYKVYFPMYNKSKDKQTLTGWILLQFGDIPSNLDDKFKSVVKRFPIR